MLTDFRNFFTVGLISKFATKRVSYFPPHLQRVATLPCEKHDSKILTCLTQYHRSNLLLIKLAK